MDDLLVMRGGEAVRELDGEVDGPLRRDGTFWSHIGRGVRDRGVAVHHIAQRPSLEELGDDEGRAFVRAEFEDGEEIRMIQHAGGASFLLEAAKTIAVVREGRRKDLDRDFAAEARITGAVNLTHAPGPERTENLIGANECPSSELHWMCRRLWRKSGRIALNSSGASATRSFADRTSRPGRDKSACSPRPSHTDVRAGTPGTTCSCPSRRPRPIAAR